MSAPAASLAVLLIGCGKMGSALVAGWLERGLSASDILIVEPHLGKDIPKGVRVLASAQDLPAQLAPQVVLFAVKPQVMDQTVPAYGRFVDGSVFLSIAAGRTIKSFERLLGTNAAVVRAMPNTPAAVRRGISALCANAKATPKQRAACQDLLEAVGEALWTEDEGQMDAVTAVSGSGPAYVFLLAECLAEAGVKAGLSSETAARLARATVAGAGELLRQSPETPAHLRENVTSPGGTTAAALAVLMGKNGLSPLLTEAVGQATRRSRELAG